MPIEIIPAIIAKSFDEIQEKVGIVESYVKWVQLDIMDGKFVPNTTWNEPEDVRSWKPKVLLEAHLMIQEPEKQVEKWIDAGVQRIIFHIEAANDPKSIVHLCHKKGVEVGVAINPETPYHSLRLGTGQASLDLDMVLIMGVTPGFSGQKFQSSVLPKIRSLRHLHPHLTIGVDGGMNPETAKMAIEAGANIIVAGSYIYDSDNIGEAIKKLENVNSHIARR